MSRSEVRLDVIMQRVSTRAIRPHILSLFPPLTCMGKTRTDVFFLFFAPAPARRWSHREYDPETDKGIAFSDLSRVGCKQFWCDATQEASTRCKVRTILLTVSDFHVNAQLGQNKEDWIEGMQKPMPDRMHYVYNFICT